MLLGVLNFSLCLNNVLLAVGYLYLACQVSLGVVELMRASSYPFNPMSSFGC